MPSRRTHHSMLPTPCNFVECKFQGQYTLHFTSLPWDRIVKRPYGLHRGTRKNGHRANITCERDQGLLVNR